MPDNLTEISRALAYINERLPEVILETQALLAEPRLNLSITQWHRTRQLEEGLKKTRALLTALNNNIADEMMPAQLDLNGLKFAPHALGTVRLNNHFKATQKGDRAAIHAWLKTHDLGDLVVPTVNARTLAAALKEPFLKGDQIPPTDLIECRVRRYASFTDGDDNAPEAE